MSTKVAIKVFSWSNSFKMKKILIVIGDAGGGHIACAKAIESALYKREKDLDVRRVDLFKLSKITRNYDFFYYLVSRFRLVEKIYNIGYWMINGSYIFSEVASFFTTSYLYRPTLKYLKEFNPDIVICNNGPTARVLSRCKKILGFKYVITVPDLLSVSRWWADKEADIIFCPTKEVEDILKGYCPECKCVSPFYPLREVVRYSKEEIDTKRRKLFKEFSFKEDIATILITGCGLATRDIVKDLMYFMKSKDHQFIILTGKDDRLNRRLTERFLYESNVVVKGYTTSILDLFAVSDLIIAKPGPATLLEIERLGKKAIFTRPIGYQEWGNVEYLLQNPNFIYVGEDLELIEEEIKVLLEKEIGGYESPILDSNSIIEYLFKSDF